MSNLKIRCKRINEDVWDVWQIGTDINMNSGNYKLDTMTISTDLFDHSGKEAYEGDVVVHIYKNQGDSYSAIIGVVTYRDGEWCLAQQHVVFSFRPMIFCDLRTDATYIVGNIFDSKFHIPDNIIGLPKEFASASNELVIEWVMDILKNQKTI